ncbi:MULTISPECIES: XRE family transcriptional regulator [unclassified Bacteroides]|jgi:hypothetical protein|uniref:XRE family transcriptional regulator n=1 Tax=unclassified Bacteroides TaxID=2646097 RepID=UPI000E9D15AA|nr:MULTISPECIES: XRE family transcriptional regulator [unclassified Bacteroides]RGN43805.1 XRE family transcriptional regulator [Bacteroides sp. OM05-12]RHR73846.1 XRE family transcriptional regulator [Bacteroides sp. AF16-49]
MNNGRWTPEEEQYVRENAGKKTFTELAEHIGRSELAVQLFLHRKKIVIGKTVKRNLVQEILRIKFRHPENFMPNRSFYKEVNINQMRFWDIYFGRKQVTQEEYIALSEYFGLTLQEAFEARQLNIFDEI